MFNNVLQFPGGKSNIQRDNDGAQLHKGQICFQDLISVQKYGCHAVPFLYPASGKGLGPFIGVGLPLGIGPSALFRNNCLLIRVFEGGPFQKIWYGGLDHFNGSSKRILVKKR